MLLPGVIEIGIPPEFEVGPVTLAWHGIMIAVGILCGGVLAGWLLRREGLSTDPLSVIGLILVAGGVIGGRLFYVLEHGGELFSTRGYTFNGGVIAAAVGIAAYVWRAGLDRRYIDAVAVGLPLGVAIGRIGDVINGEHYGRQSDFFLAVRNSHPDALTPDPTVAFHSGGMMEVILGLVIFAIVFPLRDRLPRVGDAAWLVLGLFALGRFFEMFVRDDSPVLALGLDNAQWTSLAMIAVIVVARTVIGLRGRPPAGEATGPARRGSSA